MSPTSLYSGLLGPAWSRVDERVRAAHLSGEGLRGRGSFRITNGRSALARALVRLMRMPRTAARETVELIVRRFEEGERWMRSFGDRTLVTTQRAAPGNRLAERVGCLEFLFRLEVADGAIRYRQEGVALRCGLLRLELPVWLSPKVVAVEAADATGQRSRVSVSVSAPLAGLLLHYDGYLEVER